MYIHAPGRWLAAALAAVAAAAVVYGWTKAQTSAVLGSVFILSGMTYAGVAMWQDMTAHGRWREYQAAFRTLRAQLRRLMFWRKPAPVTIQVHPAYMKVTAMPARVIISGGTVAADTSVEEKIEHLLKRVEQIENEAMEDRRQHKADYKALKADMNHVYEKLKNADDELGRVAQALALDTVPLQMRGLILVGVGTLITTIPGIVGW